MEGLGTKEADRGLCFNSPQPSMEAEMVHLSQGGSLSLAF